MRIDSIDLYRVAMPLIYPHRTAYGEDAVIESLLVRMASGSHCGWGEATPLKAPTYSPECSAGQLLVARDFIAPSLAGQDIRTGKDLQHRMSFIKGNFFAKAGFDLAWWDLHARMLEKPLWRIIGGRQPTVQAGAVVGVDDTMDGLLEHIDTSIRQGYGRVKLKFRPGWDVPMLEAVRARFPKLVIHIDCNSAYTLDDLDLFADLDRFNLAMIEQPLGYDDLVDHARLQERIATPVCLDESITSVDKTRKALQLKACRWVNIKPGRVGGMTNALEINRLCMDARVPCWVGSMLESGIGMAHLVALGTLPNMDYPGDILPGDRLFNRHLEEPRFMRSGPGQFTALEAPGIGVEPQPDALKAFTLESAHLNSK